jgi:hypothetical protein
MVEKDQRISLTPQESTGAGHCHPHHDAFDGNGSGYGAVAGATFLFPYFFPGNMTESY